MSEEIGVYVDWGKLDLLTYEGLMINCTYFTYYDLGFDHNNALKSYNSYLKLMHESSKKVKKDA